MTPPPTYLHDDAASRLNRMLADYLTKTENKGKLYFPRAGIVRSPNSWLEPDLFYIAAETKAYSDPNHPQYKSTADLVIEIILPSSAIYDRNTKADTYAALGVKELWLVEETSGIIEVRVLQGDRYAPSVVLERDDELKSTVFPELKIEVGSVFSDQS